VLGRVATRKQYAEHFVRMIAVIVNMKMVLSYGERNESEFW
jgi:hypothetical protein